MLIDKIAQYRTDQDRRQLDEAQEQLKRAQTEYIDALIDSKGNDSQELTEASKKLFEAFRMEDVIEFKALERYYKATGKKQLMADAEEIINAVEKEDFQMHIKHLENGLLTSLIVKHKGDPDIYNFNHYIERTKENYTNCFKFILRTVAYQIEGLHRLGDDQSAQKIKALIDKRVSLWYVNKNPIYVNIYHEKGLDTLPYMNPKNAVIDDINKSLAIEKQGVKLEILDFEKLGGAPVTINAHKLLMKAVSEFTNQNSTGNREPSRHITISLKEYAEALGYDVTEKHTATPEEAEKERKRVKNQLDNVRKAIKGDLKRLSSFRLTREEKVKGKMQTLAYYAIFSKIEYSSGEIKASFTPEIADALISKNLLTKYPTALLRITGKNPNAYPIGCKLAEHYHMYNNRIKDTNKNISVKKILENSPIISYEELQKTDPGHWEARIKEPMEDALEILTRGSVITSWKYIHAGGVDLSDEEARNISTYKDFINLYVHYEMPDPGDEERIKEKREQRQKAIARKKRAKKKQG